MLKSALDFLVLSYLVPPLQHFVFIIVTFDTVVSSSVISQPSKGYIYLYVTR
jgi:hypothetical protein